METEELARELEAKVESIRQARGLAKREAHATDLGHFVFQQWPRINSRLQATPAPDEGLRELLREPTEAMLDAAWHQTGESKEMRVRVHHRMKRYWQAMFDAALSPALPGGQPHDR